MALQPVPGTFSRNQVDSASSAPANDSNLAFSTVSSPSNSSAPTQMLVDPRIIQRQMERIATVMGRIEESEQKLATMSVSLQETTTTLQQTNRDFKTDKDTKKKTEEQAKIIDGVGKKASSAREEAKKAKEVAAKVKKKLIEGQDEGFEIRKTNRKIFDGVNIGLFLAKAIQTGLLFSPSDGLLFGTVETGVMVLEHQESTEEPTCGDLKKQKEEQNREELKKINESRPSSTTYAHTSKSSYETNVRTREPTQKQREQLSSEAKNSLDREKRQVFSDMFASPFN